MLDTQTKSRIDSARNILVGKVPDPKSQVEQITIALIYKFMDDMDNASVELGGNRSFFTGNFEKYVWTKLFDLKLSGQDMLNLYGEAISNFSFNENLPQLFRDIFKNAYLPFRDPPTLKLFLKTINEFDYEHSEKLGDSFEYLLSVLGSQGDAGQFRTPRHIIDFLVEIVNPQKHETIADPACGTAGFLISSYKHILKQNTDKVAGDKLTPDERTKLMSNLVGYDISPDMVRLSLVNLYLHGFQNPRIEEYDTLTSEDRWDEHFDVILANPPFMTPKGGIRPHKKFSVQANKAEVLFTDYIAEHIHPLHGRAGIIVPNGIVATSNNAYKELRRLLVQDSLIAVISLPAGVFNPYSGVKTSILILDKALAKKTDKILFCKVNNDGFDLGAQRRPIEKNDLNTILHTIKSYKNSLQSDSNFGQIDEHSILVSKEDILSNRDISLGVEKFFNTSISYQSVFDMVNINTLCDFRRGQTITKKQTVDGNIPVIAGGQKPAYYHNVSNREGETITVSSSGAYSGFVNYFDYPIFASDCFTISPKDNNQLSTKFLYLLLKFRQNDIYGFQEGGGQPHVYPKHFEDFEIPLPPLEIQNQIIAEIDKYQNIINGAKQIIANYKPNIALDSSWDIVTIGDLVDIKYGVSVSIPSNLDDEGIKIISTAETTIDGELDLSQIRKIRFEKKYKNFILEPPLLLFNWRNAPKHVGKTVYFDLHDVDYTYASFLLSLKLLSNKVSYNYLWFYLNKLRYEGFFIQNARQAVNQANFNAEELRNVTIPIPPPEVLEKFETDLLLEKKLIQNTRELIQYYGNKIDEIVSQIWGK